MLINFPKEVDDEDDESYENKKKDLIIKLNLYRSGEKELIQRFLRKSGDKHEYNKKVLYIISLAQKLNRNKN